MSSASGPAAHRRDFLTGRAAVKAVDGLLDQVGGDETPVAVSRPASYLVEVSRAAMACEFQVLLDAQLGQTAIEAAIEALDHVERLEAQLSFFRNSSELSFINHWSASKPVRVESHLFRLLQYCRQVSTETGGAFDITAAPLWKLWGFQRRSGRLPTPEEIASALANVSYEAVFLDSDEETVQFQREGIELNLGAVGKGYALDRAAENLNTAGVEDYLIHGGNSSILAHGSRIQGQGDGWSVAVRHPLRPQKRIAEVRLRDRALGTSGSANQFFHHQGKRYSHILDPRTGWPAEQVVGTTVLAPTATEADALSTAFYVMGVEKAQEYCQSHPDVAALIVAAGKREGELQLHAIGLSHDEWHGA